jgi:hypothetical protein
LMLEAVCASVTMDAAVRSMRLPDGVVDEFMFDAGVGVISALGVFEFCAIVVVLVVVGLEPNLGTRAHNPRRMTATIARVMPIISPVRFLRGGVGTGIGKGCA